MKIRGMGFACIKRDNDALMAEINFHILHAFDFHEWCTQLSHAFVAVFALGRNLDRFQNRVISAFGIKRIGRVGIVWSCGVPLFFI